MADVRSYYRHFHNDLFFCNFDLVFPYHKEDISKSRAYIFGLGLSRLRLSYQSSMLGLHRDRASKLMRFCVCVTTNDSAVSIVIKSGLPGSYVAAVGLV